MARTHLLGRSAFSVVCFEGDTHLSHKWLSTVDVPPLLLDTLKQAAETLQQDTETKVNFQQISELHISLSRDLYIRSGQREHLINAAKSLAQTVKEP